MDLAFTLFAFLLAGLVKGTVGLGLPLVSIALLTPVLGLADAKALMLVPAALTNLVQACQGPGGFALARRLMALLIPLVCVSAVAGALLADLGTGALDVALGVALIVYVALDVTPLDLTIDRSKERSWGVAAGLTTVHARDIRAVKRSGYLAPDPKAGFSAQFGPNGWQVFTKR